jgi:hypothetical protein
LAQGFTETLTNFGYSITANCTPESPQHLGVYGGATGNVESRYSSDGSTLAAPAAAGDTSLSVATPSGPLWTTSGGDVPFDLRIRGERITVTAISGSSSPQTFTVTRAVNGISLNHPAGSTVGLWRPVYYAQRSV